MLPTDHQPLALPSGELSSGCETERVCVAAFARYPGCCCWRFCQCLPPLGERLPRSGGGGTKCRMRGEQPLAPSAGAPSSVSSLRSSTPSPDRGKASVETGSGMAEGSILALSVFAAQIHLPQRGRLWQYGKAFGFAKGSPFGRAVTAGD